MDGVAPSRMVAVSASVNHIVQKFSSGTVSPGWWWWNMDAL